MQGKTNFLLAVGMMSLLWASSATANVVMFLTSIANGKSFTASGQNSAIHLFYKFAILEREARASLRYELVGGISEVPLARSRQVIVALKDPTVTHVVFADADIEFHPDDVERLLAIDRDVVGIPAPMHQGGMRWDVMLEAAKAQGVLQKGLLFDVNVDLLPGERKEDGTAYYAMTDADEFGFLPVRSVGLGLLVVKREVLEELVAAFPDTWISDPVQGAVPCVFCVLGDEVPNKPHVATSEYAAFAERLRALGKDIWVDTTRTVGHMGRLTFESRTFREGVPPTTIGHRAWADVDTVRKMFPHFW